MRTQPPHREPADRQRVNVHEPWEEMYWGEKLGCTAQQLRASVDAVGERVVDIKAYLAKTLHNPHPAVHKLR
ncbi:DUF3606 domain-containing protein [Polaromonas sp. SM01]|uniref:DUF3606 domain-containing protein n=1 Tax=Polaromonas sp. SM01 TaxID=3085630 RepID=UPI002981E984|nr:DUF3606 domain-containing protein [Polaromonas sp. SM01]MDW5441493.1 DUF3606 domain-containing protein [Polaromonas sp. SM01]